MRFVILNDDQLVSAVSDIRTELEFGRPLQLEVKPFKRNRTLSQNAKIHSMIRDLSMHTGYTESEMKEIVKSAYGPTKCDVIGGEEVAYTKPTSQYDVEEMASFVERLYQLGAELDVTWSET